MTPVSQPANEDKQIEHLFHKTKTSITRQITKKRERGREPYSLIAYVQPHCIIGCYMLSFCATHCIMMLSNCQSISQFFRCRCCASPSFKEFQLSCRLFPNKIKQELSNIRKMFQKATPLASGDTKRCKISYQVVATQDSDITLK